MVISVLCSVTARPCHRTDVRSVRRSKRSTLTRASASTSDGMYDGTVLFHVFPQLSAPKPIFTTFLEGALYCAEVAKSHPNYQTAHFHESHDAEKAINEEAHAYLAMSLFSCAPESLWTEFEDLKECLDIGHMDQEHHPLVCREIAAFPRPTSDIASAPHGAVRYAETDSTVVVAIDVSDDEAMQKWTQWSGAEAAANDSSFLGATLHKCVEDNKKYSHAVRGELGNVAESVVDKVVKEATEQITDLLGADGDEKFVVQAYRVAFNIEKTGTPAGALPAVREMQRKQTANEKEKAEFCAKKAAEEVTKSAE